MPTEPKRIGQNIAVIEPNATVQVTSVIIMLAIAFWFGSDRVEILSKTRQKRSQDDSLDDRMTSLTSVSNSLP
jgi:hypothetical protein